MRITRLFVRRPTLVTVFLALVAVTALVAYLSRPKPTPAS